MITVRTGYGGITPKVRTTSKVAAMSPTGEGFSPRFSKLDMSERTDNSRPLPNRMIGRRQLLGGGAALFTCMQLPVARADLDFDDPDDLLTAAVKLRGTLDDRMVIWWMKGVRYGVVKDELNPLFNMLVGSFSRYKEVPGRGYQVTMLELGYLTDLETGEPLDEFKNPYTGKVVKVPEQRLGPLPVMLTSSGVEIDSGATFAEIDLRTRLGPAIVEGDDIWLREDSTAKVDSDLPMMGKHVYNELVTYRGRVSDVNNPDLAAAPATVAYQSVTSWREWFKSGGMPGHTTARAAGRKIFSVDELPADYLAAAQARHPEIIADPEAALDAPAPVPH